jgi:hypothetical protein
MQSETQQSISDAFVERMSTWYGIQIALLHPLVQTVFAKPRSTKNRKAAVKALEKAEGRRVKYVRTHSITTEAVDASLDYHGLDPDVARKFTRKTLAWYVIGFWREDPHKGKIFVKGHWRGPLRKVKRNLDDIRQRDIAQVDDN